MIAWMQTNTQLDIEPLVQKISATNKTTDLD